MLLIEYFVRNVTKFIRLANEDDIILKRCFKFITVYSKNKWPYSNAFLHKINAYAVDDHYVKGIKPWIKVKSTGNSEKIYEREKNWILLYLLISTNDNSIV